MKKTKSSPQPRIQTSGASLLSFAPLIVLLGVWMYSCQHPFFWDTIQLASRQAQWYYDQNFSYLLLPDEIDSGHPSSFGMYLALCWKLFGQNLLVSHAAMLPFLGLLLIGLFRMARDIDQPWGQFLPLLLVLDPVVLGQSSLVSPDVVLLALFLWGLLHIIRPRSTDKYQIVLILCALGLAMLSLRGMMAVMVLYLYQVSTVPDRAWRKPLHWLHLAWPYVPAGIFAVVFLLYHAQAKSWVGFHEDSPWRESFNLVGLNGMLKNAVILSWRLLDYGRIFLVLSALTLIFTQKKLLLANRFFPLLVFALLPQLPHFLLLQGVSAHRYLLPVFLAGHLLFLTLLAQSQLKLRTKSIILAFALLGLASGNTWIYPRGIAQGWDSTPAHWPHFMMRKTLIAYLEQHKIPLAEVGTVFPEIGPLHWRDLQRRQDGFSPLDLEQNQYVYYSSVMNDFSDEQLQILFQKWSQVWVQKKGNLETILFKKPF